MRLFIYFLLFAAIGVAQEVFWTSWESIKAKNRNLVGKSTLWMFLIYGGVLFIVLLVQWLYSAYPWWLRGFMYMGLIFAWEYVTGWVILKFFKARPWDYSTNDCEGVCSKKRFHIQGLVCLEYLPVWFVGGLLAEALYLFLETHLFL